MPRLRSEAQLESAIEHYLCTLCTALGAKCIKNQNKRGFFDRTVYWFEGMTDLIELKRPKGGRYEPLQERTHATFRRMGHNVFVINTKEQVDLYIASRMPFAHPARRLKK